MIVGLAPGMHGANRTGRPFTGDHAGILLYRSLHELGLASAPASVDRGDGLQLRGVRITNAVSSGGVDLASRLTRTGVNVSTKRR